MTPFVWGIAVGVGVGFLACAVAVFCLAWFAGQRPPDPVEWDLGRPGVAAGHYVSARSDEGVVATAEWCAGPPGWVRR